MESQEIVSKLADGLDSGALLPFPLRAKVLHTDYRFPLGERDLGVDLVVEFTTDKHTVTAVIECKSRLTPSTVEGLLYEMRQLESHRRSSPFRNAKAMIAAPYISEPLRLRFKEAGIGYLDLNGSFYLSGDDLYIDIARPKGPYGNPQGTKNIFVGKSRRVIRVLLCHPYTPFRLEDLAKQTQLSPAQVFQVFQRLQDHGVIERSSAGRQLTKPRKLLNLLSSEARRDYQTNRVIFQGFYDGDPQVLTRNIADYCDTRAIDCALTLFSGLESRERNVIENLSAVYVSGDPAKIAADLKIPFASIGANVLIMRAPERDNTAAGGVFYETRKLLSGAKAVNMVQEYLDFSLYPGRGEEQARFLLEEVLAYRE